MERLHYFAYGSNMSTRRLRDRVPSARAEAPVSLAGHRLAWHKQGRDGSGKCDIPMVHDDDIVYGVLYSIEAEHKYHLDRAEGLGWGYQQKQVEVRRLDSDESVSAFTYYAVRVDPRYVPYDWYKDHVLIGAREHGLPELYVRMIENVPTFEDANKQRERRERRLQE